MVALRDRLSSNYTGALYLTDAERRQRALPLQIYTLLTLVTSTEQSGRIRLRR
jgi:hypothetical protein